MLTKRVVPMLGWMGVAALLLGAGCSDVTTADSHGRDDMTTVPATATAHATVSDSGEFDGVGGWSIRQNCTNSPTVLFQLYGSARPGDMGTLGWSLALDPESSRAMMSGGVVAATREMQVGYPVPGGLISRPVQSVQMTLMPGRWFRMVMNLGAATRTLGEPRGDLAPSATIHLVGTSSVGCELIRRNEEVLPDSGVGTGDQCGGSSIFDPTFSSPTCRDALQSFGLDPLFR